MSGSVSAVLVTDYDPREVEQVIVPKLEQRGAQVTCVLTLREARRNKDAIKSGDIVLYMHEYANHSTNYKIKQFCKQSGRDVINLTRHSSKWPDFSMYLGKEQDVRMRPVVKGAKESLDESFVRKAGRHLVIGDDNVESYTTEVRRMIEEGKSFSQIYEKLKHYWPDSQASLNAVKVFTCKLPTKTICPTAFRQWWFGGGKDMTIASFSRSPFDSIPKVTKQPIEGAVLALQLAPKQPDKPPTFPQALKEAEEMANLYAQERDEARAELEASLKNLSTTRADLSATQQELEKLRFDVKKRFDASVRGAAAADQVRELEETLVTVRAALKQEQEYNRSVNEIANKQGDSIKEMGKRLTERESQVESLTDKLDDFAKQLQAIEKDLQEKRVTEANLREELKDARAMLDARPQGTSQGVPLLAVLRAAERAVEVGLMDGSEALARLVKTVEGQS